MQLATPTQSVPNSQTLYSSPQAELQAALQMPIVQISPKFFYDELGSCLFDAICQLPEYYLTRCETAIFAAHSAQIAQACGQAACLIEPGAGNCRKAASLFADLQPRQYVAIDISAQYLENALQQLRHRFPQTPMLGLGMDFSQQLILPAEVESGRRLFFYPGSSIGNFAPKEAAQWLRRMRKVCDHDGGLLIGVDLIKEKAILDAAYDDALGVTAAFNLNLLRHVAGLLDMRVDLADWQHKAFFNPQLARVEMHLEARRNLHLEWQGGGRHFERGETIHTENSYKYTLQSFQNLLQSADFAPKQVWQDANSWYAVVYAEAA